MSNRLFLVVILIGIAALTGCGSDRECSNPVAVTEFGRSLNDTTLALGGEPLVLYALGGETPLFKSIDGGTEHWRLEAHNPSPDSVIDYKAVTDSGKYDHYGGLDTQDRVVVEARKLGRDELRISAVPVTPYTCGIPEVWFTIRVVE